jgi:hypothetical protein
MIGRIHESGHPDFVFVDRVPRVYGLRRSGDPNGSVVAWVLVLPSGVAVVFDMAGEVMAHTSLERLGAGWARRSDLRLVQVMDDPATRCAA